VKSRNGTVFYDSDTRSRTPIGKCKKISPIFA
jgi:hypothetical protein